MTPGVSIDADPLITALYSINALGKAGCSDDPVRGFYSREAKWDSILHTLLCTSKTRNPTQVNTTPHLRVFAHRKSRPTDINDSYLTHKKKSSRKMDFHFIFYVITLLLLSAEGNGASQLLLGHSCSIYGSRSIYLLSQLGCLSHERAEVLRGPLPWLSARSGADNAGTISQHITPPSPSLHPACSIQAHAYSRHTNTYTTQSAYTGKER